MFSLFKNTTGNIWLLAILFFVGSHNAQSQNTARLSWMTDLPSAHLYQMLSDSSMQADLAMLKPTIRMGMVDLDSSRLELIKLLDSLEVPMTAWLLLPNEEGKSLDWKQSERAKQRYEEFLQWTHDHQLNWSGIALAVVPDAKEQEWLDGQRSRYAEHLFSRMYEEEDLLASRVGYQNLIHQMQADGYLVELYMPAYHLDAQKAGSSATQWITGVPILEADVQIPMLQMDEEHALAMVASYSSEEAVKKICLLMPSAQTNSMAWKEAATLVQEAGDDVEEITLYIPDLSRTSEIIPNLARFEWEGVSPLSSSELNKAGARRQKMQRLFDLLRYPKLVLAGLGVLLLLSLIAFVRILIRMFS